VNVLCVDFVGEDVASDRVRDGHGGRSLVACPAIAGVACLLLSIASLQLSNGLAYVCTLIVVGSIL